MKDLEKKLLEICGDEKVFENEEIGFNYTDKDLNPRMKKDLEVLDLEIFANIYLFLKEIGYKSIRVEKTENYYTQYFKK